MVLKFEGIDASKYQISRLKSRLKTKYPDLVFYQPSDQTKSELPFLINAGEGALLEGTEERLDDSQASAS